MAEEIIFPADYPLEGIYEAPEERVAWGGVVVAHPHPLHGGTMQQPVVYRTAQSCRKLGLATLRFNFRGVGKSEGSYSGLNEYRDVEAAAAYLRGRLDAGKDPDGVGRQGRPIALAGYSFGSIMAAMAAGGSVSVHALALIAFVVNWEDSTLLFERLTAFSGRVLALCGEDDEIGPPEEVERLLNRVNLDFSLSVVPGANHFFEGAQKEVGERVAAFFGDALGARHA